MKLKGKRTVYDEENGVTFEVADDWILTSVGAWIRFKICDFLTAQTPLKCHNRISSLVWLAGLVANFTAIAVVVVNDKQSI